MESGGSMSSNASSSSFPKFQIQVPIQFSFLLYKCIELYIAIYMHVVATATAMHGSLLTQLYNYS